MKAAPTILTLLLLGLTSAPALAQDRPATLSERVARLESRAGGGGGSMVADLVVEMRRLQQEVRSLRGDVERLKHELEGVKARQRDQYLDLDRRLQALSKQAGPVQQNSAPPASNPAPTQQSVPVQGSATPAPDTRELTIARNPPAADADARRAAYSAAKDLLLAEQYADAAAAFRAFVQQYPSGPFSDNAQYWLGESYYVTGNYDLALNAFQAVVSQHPDSTKVAGAMLKLGYSYYELEQWEQARTALTQVIEQFEGSSEARLAQSRLRVMRIESAKTP